MGFDEASGTRLDPGSFFFYAAHYELHLFGRDGGFGREGREQRERGVSLLNGGLCSADVTTLRGNLSAVSKGLIIDTILTLARLRINLHFVMYKYDIIIVSMYGDNYHCFITFG